MTDNKKQAGISDLFPGVFGADQNPEMLAADAARQKMQQEIDGRLKEHYGQNMRRSLGYGLAAGAGATALYHILKSMRAPKKKEKKYDEMNSGAPVVAKMAGEKKAEGGLDELLGGLLPREGVPGFSAMFGGEGGEPGMESEPLPQDPHTFRPSWAALGALGAGAAGLYGGSKAVNAVVKARKKRDAEDEIEEARQAYYAALFGTDKKATALDSAFEKWQEKKANPIAGMGTFLGETVPQNLHLGTVLAMLASGGVAGKMMYDWQKDRNKGDNLAKAQASKARMKGLPTMWVDPDELAQVKQLAAQSSNE